MTSPSRAAFLRWYAESSLGGTPTDEAEAAFQAGIEHTLNTIGHLNRKGSDLRGRVVHLFRPLTSVELGREEPPRPWPLVWPCLELDDGTVVYAAKQAPSLGLRDDKPRYGPAQLVGQKKIDGKWQKVSFDMSVQDIDPTRAVAAFQRGIQDGDRMQKGEATPDQVVQELESDPL